MKKNVSRLTLLILTMIIMSSCSYRIIDFTVISSKNVSLMIDKTKGKKVTGSSNGFLGMGASIKDAMDKALESAGPEYDLLLDGVVKVNDYFIVAGYKVEGTAISSSQMKALLGNDGFKDWCKTHNIFEPETADINN